MTVRTKAELLAAITPLLPASWTDTQLTDLIDSIDAGAGGGGIGAPRPASVAQRNEFSGEITVPVPQNTYMNLPWVLNADAGDVPNAELFDLTDPTQPIALAGGIYSVGARVGMAAIEGGFPFYMNISSEPNDVSDQAGWFPTDTHGNDAGGSQSMIVHLEAGNGLTLNVYHNNPQTIDVHLSATIQQLFAD